MSAGRTTRGSMSAVAAWWVAISRSSRRSSSAEASSYSAREARRDRAPGAGRGRPARPGTADARPRTGATASVRLVPARPRAGGPGRRRASRPRPRPRRAPAVARIGVQVRDQGGRPAGGRRCRYALAIVVVDGGPDQVGRGIGGAVAPPVDPGQPVAAMAPSGWPTAAFRGPCRRVPWPGAPASARSNRRWPPGVVKTHDAALVRPAAERAGIDAEQAARRTEREPRGRGDAVGTSGADGGRAASVQTGAASGPEGADGSAELGKPRPTRRHGNLANAGDRPGRPSGRG